MSDCIFCKIVAGQASGDIVHQDERVTAFRDIHPAAPVHILIVPNRHIERLATVDPAEAELLGHIVLLAPKIAEQMGIAHSGYRLLTNQGRHAGQIIDHLHWHLLGGRRLGRVG